MYIQYMLYSSAHGQLLITYHLVQRLRRNILNLVSRCIIYCGLVQHRKELKKVTIKSVKTGRIK